MTRCSISPGHLSRDGEGLLSCSTPPEHLPRDGEDFPLDGSTVGREAVVPGARGRTGQRGHDGRREPWEQAGRWCQGPTWRAWRKKNDASSTLEVQYQRHVEKSESGGMVRSGLFYFPSETLTNGPVLRTGRGPAANRLHTRDNGRWTRLLLLYEVRPSSYDARRSRDGRLLSDNRESAPCTEYLLRDPASPPFGGLSRTLRKGRRLAALKGAAGPLSLVQRRVV